MKPADIHGYSDRLSVAPGETIEFKVSCERPGDYRADLVRLINGDTNPQGPGFREQLVDADINGEYPGRFQPIDAGSCVVVSDPEDELALAGSFTIHAFIMPTTPGKPDQCILSRGRRGATDSVGLYLHEGCLQLEIGAEVLRASQPLRAGLWYSVAACLDAGGNAVIRQRAVVNSVNSLLAPVVVDDDTHQSAGQLSVPGDKAVPIVIAGARAVADSTAIDCHYNGRIDSPRLWSRAIDDAEFQALCEGRPVAGTGLLAHWDFSDGIGPRGIPTDHVTDIGPHACHGACVNMPARAMTGWNWDGREENFRHAPAQYGAIHFHDDDIDDCRWDTDIAFTIPQDLPSDCYALRVTMGDAEDHLPFFVLPPRGTATARVLFLVPTASYLAYANNHILTDVPVGQSIVGHVPVIGEQEIYLYAHPELGLSTYDAHSDGSGVCFSSARRPIVNMRPKYRFGGGAIWQFPADLHLVDWLNARGIDYDVATDLELHQEGAALLSRYQCVLTGTHPEYYSSEMLDGWEQYLGSGGRGMYLGANGFYWITAWHPEKPWTIEVRKAETGSRAWQARPGEYYLQCSGERSGIWRARARAPQKLFGTGFTAEGFDRSSYFRQMSDAAHPAAAFIMDGVRRDELIGDFGTVGGGAAGWELDRYDLSLGTPPETLLLAASEGHSDNYPHVAEEIMFNFPGLFGSEDFQVRADMTYFPTRSGGGMFSSSSISWCGSLAHNNYDNNVSRITENVLRRFMDATPLPPIDAA